MQVTIIGGGVAGSAAALAMRRIGADVTVFEAHPDPAGPIGSFVSLAVNGLRALDAFGCLPAVQAAGFPVDRHRMWSGRGRLLGDVPRGRRADDPLRSVTLLRADLVGTLRDAARTAGARFALGERTDLTAVLAAEPDLVIAADGIRSTARTALDPTAPLPRPAGIVTISGVSPRPPTAAPDGFNWVFGRDGVFLYLPTPDGDVWWSAQITDRHREPTADTVGTYFRTEPIPAAILATRTTVRSVTHLQTLAPVRRRHDGRTVLIGDAAHPAGAGQGASMALEDAVLLAQAVANHPRIDAALTAFDALRLPRAGKLATMEARNRDAKTAGPVAARIREFVMPLVFDRFYERATAWLYDTPPFTLPQPAQR